MLKTWRDHRMRRFIVYRKRSSLKWIILLGLILVIILYLDRLT